MPIFISLILATEEPLGKVEHSSLSHQTLIELFFSQITNIHELYGESDTTPDITEWTSQNDDRLEFSDDNPTEVIGIRFSSCDLCGSIQLEWIPNGVSKCDLSDNTIVGTIDLLRLPDSLELLDLIKNELDGTICLTNLPRGMTELYLSENLFQGTVDLRNLPQALRSLSLDMNGLSGMTDFSHLPASLQYFDVRETQIEGTLFAPEGVVFSVDNSNVKIIGEE